MEEKGPVGLPGTLGTRGKTGVPGEPGKNGKDEPVGQIGPQVSIFYIMLRV